ncbi:phosphoglycolate phosphatase [Acidianus sulfidivorans JP7]|uniref:Phosphoglycolate phosphatase n=1 Tax=Acidianus sulfidivorans JP7 TaxID=619593 RepID=A0A2U9IKL3_9CREN|nr:phosphoglycolate phosphatase [Acidianus sulfidivorans]AWR96560.1 phosphoglycolate phosphatase [Acidianus sulfidivorans JP7]
MYLVASDYDRTLASEKNNFVISKEVAEKVNEFAKKYYFVVVTGREKRFINILASSLKPNAWILENGSFILMNDKEYYLVDDDWFSIRDTIAKKLDNMGIQYSIGKVIIYLDNAIKLRNKISIENASIEWNRNDAMIMPTYVNKGYGLRKLIEIINFKGKTIGIGDSENDISLFKSVDFKVAVGNALEEIKEIADLVLEEENGNAVIKLLNIIETGKIEELIRYS